MTNNARMLVLDPAMYPSKRTLPGVGPARNAEEVAIEERETLEFSVPEVEEEDEETGVYEIGPRRPLPYECI